MQHVHKLLRALSELHESHLLNICLRMSKPSQHDAKMTFSWLALHLHCVKIYTDQNQNHTSFKVPLKLACNSLSVKSCTYISIHWNFQSQAETNRQRRWSNVILTCTHRFSHCTVDSWGVRQKGTICREPQRVTVLLLTRQGRAVTCDGCRTALLKTQTYCILVSVFAVGWLILKPNKCKNCHNVNAIL